MRGFKSHHRFSPKCLWRTNRSRLLTLRSIFYGKINPQKALNIPIHLPLLVGWYNNSFPKRHKQLTCGYKYGLSRFGMLTIGLSFFIVLLTLSRFIGPTMESGVIVAHRFSRFMGSGANPDSPH